MSKPTASLHTLLTLLNHNHGSLSYSRKKKKKYGILVKRSIQYFLGNDETRKTCRKDVDFVMLAFFFL